MDELINRMLKFCDYEPSPECINAFWEELQGVDRLDFIANIFSTPYEGSIQDLFIATFSLWKDLSYAQWQEIYHKVSSSSYAEYYFLNTTAIYIGVDWNPYSLTEKDESHFIGNSDKIHYLNELELLENLNITLDMLEKVRERLEEERRQYIAKKT